VRKIFARALFTAFMFMYVCSWKILEDLLKEMHPPV
jgi:hypothetical protein